jgi:uncharacterized membrane protein
MNNDLKNQRIQLFLRYKSQWAAALLVMWMIINVIVLATSKWMEYQREGKSLPLWEPVSWEVSSNLIVLLLVPLGIYIHDHWFAKFSLKTRVALHALATILFSIVHVTGMVAVRHLWYGVMNSQYYFGDIPTEFFYEYRKDVQGYVSLVVVIFTYRFIVCRLQGEASYLADGDESTSKEPALPPERLLIKKMGREFLIQVSDIEWIEASGNYANLHLKSSVYPMRITMDKLEKLLPANFIRIHRSTIVNLGHIDEIQPLDTGDHQITLRCQKALVLSRRYREKFKGLVSLN